MFKHSPIELIVFKAFKLIKNRIEICIFNLLKNALGNIVARCTVVVHKCQRYVIQRTHVNERGREHG